MVGTQRKHRVARVGCGVRSAVPPVCRVELRGDHVQGVPRRDAEAVVQTEHEDHHGLAGAEPKEEAADARQHHGAPCRTTHVTTFMSTFIQWYQSMG